MTTLRPRLVKSAAMLCLVLFIAASAAWILSYLRTDVFLYPHDPDHPWVFAQADGRMLMGEGLGNVPSYQHITVPHQRGGLGLMLWYFSVSDRPNAHAGFGGFAWVQLSEGIAGERTTWGLVWPHWSVALLSGLIWAGWLVSRRRHRFAAGLCPRCGYDLRATPGQCPECGAVAPAIQPL